jgi:glutathione synthase/RimK-type ligase-like ATP-grasp enzyme
MQHKHIGILSLENDLHALAVSQVLRERYASTCHIVATDRICGTAGLNWSNLKTSEPTLPTTTRERVDVRTLDVIWCRRVNFSRVPPTITEPALIDLITHDCREATLGLVLNEFLGTWVSDPHASRLAENKLVQLRAAERAGFRIPRTLVSQDPHRIREFCESLSNRVVVKVVKGTVHIPLVTLMVTDRMLAHEEALRMCPAIYQEYIPGTCHVRANCFGDAVYAVLLKSEALDWRPNLDIPVTAFDLDERVNMRLRTVIESLGLRMGIVDLKLAEDGEPVWLEVNPQGQFLFVEGLCGINLTDAFAEFLYSTAMASRQGEISSALR